MRKFACAAVLVLVGVGLTVAEEFRAVITKVDGDKVTFHKVTGGGKGKKGEKGEAMTLSLAKDATIVKGKFADGKSEDAGALEGGVKNEAFTSGKELNARIFTSDDNKSITKIRVTIFEKKKKKDAE
jgi:hypothetical protein